MIGAIFGDIVGSIYEKKNIKTKDFDLFQDKMFFTDDSVMTIAVAETIRQAWIICSDVNATIVQNLQTFGRAFPNVGYGERFKIWLNSKKPQPYNSWGNGAAMRVSACGWSAQSLVDTRDFSCAVTEVTHNHPEGIKGAEAVAVAIYLARKGKTKDEIKKEMQKYYPLDKCLDEIRPNYKFDESCQGTVPQAIQAFLEAEDFEDAIRNAISLGGDSDTLGAITGSIAEAYFGVKEKHIEFVESKLDRVLWKVLNDFTQKLNAVKMVSH